MRRLVVLALVVCALSMPSIASAQTESDPWFASPFIGATFGGDTTSPAPVYGASAGWMGGRLGFEGEVADAPDFFEPDGFRTHRRVITAMGSALYKFGFNVGGGIIGHLSEHTGVRGDVRYLRTAGTSDSDANPFGLDLTRFEFWRASAGLVVKF